MSSENGEQYHEHLGENDTLIVFSSVVDRKGQTVNVVNVILYSKDSEAEKQCVFFTDEQILSLIGSDKFYCNNAELYKLIWQPFEKHLTEIRNIYFQPSAKLSAVSLEYCKDERGRMLCEKYNVYRISSPCVTKHMGRQKKSHKKVSIWGGIDF